MTPMEYFNSLFLTIDRISVWFGLAYFRQGYKPHALTYIMYSTMVVSIPLITYTVVTYDIETAIRALIMVAIAVQVNIAKKVTPLKWKKNLRNLYNSTQVCSKLIFPGKQVFIFLFSDIVNYFLRKSSVNLEQNSFLITYLTNNFLISNNT